MKVLKYAISLYLNTVYYTIQLLTQIKNMANCFTKFIKFGYNRLPMDMCTYRDMFQYKVYNILGEINSVKACIDYILVLRKYSFTKHI